MVDLCPSRSLRCSIWTGGDGVGKYTCHRQVLVVAAHRGQSQHGVVLALCRGTRSYGRSHCISTRGQFLACHPRFRCMRHHIPAAHPCRQVSIPRPRGEYPCVQPRPFLPDARHTALHQHRPHHAPCRHALFACLAVALLCHDDGGICPCFTRAAFRVPECRVEE